MKLCDLHTHVLPGVDDGAANMEYALQMLQNAAASEVSLLAATPHWNAQGTNTALLTDLRQRFCRLRQAAAQIPVELVLGAEVLVTEPLSPGSLPTLNDSRYLLTELPGSLEAAACETLLQSVLDRGYVPLVAHPERYASVIRDPWTVASWLDMGCHIQITGESILGNHGRSIRETAAFLLQKGLVACIASDAHGLNRRSNYLLDVYDHLCVHYSRHYAQSLMEEIPRRILHDQPL
ncbi:MAG: hypothetical protein E7437_08520 [Ruminococcaceae bacterium]|nr:hypothetical protein [Oscillospiraceae bacterium]